MYQRSLWEKLREEIESSEVVVITGARQVGKTTTLQWLLEQIGSDNKRYFDLENLVDRRLFEREDYDQVLTQLQQFSLQLDQPLYLLLDEIQFLPNLPSLVKYLHDHYRVKFFLSGSSSYYLKHHFTESMAGRKVVYELWPLSFEEFLRFKKVEYQLPWGDWEQKFDVYAYEKLHDYYDEYVRFGGLPQIVLTNDVNRKRRLLSEMYSSYINLDVQSLADFKSMAELRQMVGLLASRVGNRVNFNELSSVTGLSRQTVVNYVEFLEQTYLIRLVSARSGSEDVRARLSKKVYFVDNGMAVVNADLSSGAKFENMVAHQLQFHGQLSYWERREGEIDFILNDKRAFEVKETPIEKHLRKLEKQADSLGIANSRVIGRQRSARFGNYIWGGGIA